MELVEVPWDDPRAIRLRAAMDAEMALRYELRPGAPPHPALHLDPADVVATCLALVDGAAVGHAALRRLPGLAPDELEVKRVMVDAAARGRGVARALMAWTERRGVELGARRLVLQTGNRQPDAMALYRSLGWTEIGVYPPYDQLALSVCFALALPAE